MRYNLILLVLAGFSISTPICLANPDGATVVGGTATFEGGAGTLNISTSDRAIINWQDFSINAGELTKFIQPGADSAVLNRVIGGDVSSLLGTLSANGQVYLINPNGVLIGNGAIINTAGFVASTLDVNNDQFMAGGDLILSGNSTAQVVNFGQINASQGDVVLIARQVENNGTLTAPNGTVSLAAGKEILLTQSGSQRVFVKVGSDGSDVEGSGVANSGSISAIKAELQAKGSIYALAINNSGNISASGSQLVNGEVYLTGEGDVINSGAISTGSKGLVNISGKNVSLTDSSSLVSKGGTVKVASLEKSKVSGLIDVSSPIAKGGTVEVTGDKVGLFKTTINASGQTGGGTILVGGDFQGKNSAVKNASTTFVSPEAFLIADALFDGDGGKVIVWADHTTRYYGSLSSKGAGTGKGGFAEISGKEFLAFQGLVDLSSQSGFNGTLLLDPKNITVSSSGTDTLATNDQFAENAAGDVSFSPSAIATALSTGNLVLQANNDITISSSITATSANNALTLQAGRSIIVNPGVTLTLRGDFTATANDPSANMANRDAGVAELNMGSGSSINTTAGNGAGVGNIALFMDNASTSGDITIAGLNSGTKEVFIRNTGATAGSSIKQASSSLGIIANSAELDVQNINGNTSGSIGTSGSRLLVRLGNQGLGARAQSGGLYLSSPSANLNINNIDGASQGLAAGLVGIAMQNGGLVDIRVGTSLGLLTITDAITGSMGSSITLASDDINILAAVTTTGDVTLQTANGVALDLGSIAAGSGRYSISQTELDFVTANNLLTIGDSSTTRVQLQDDLVFNNAKVDVLKIVSGGNFSRQVGDETLTVESLAIDAATQVTLGDAISPLTKVSNLAVRSASSDGISVGNAMASGLTIGTVAGIEGISTTGSLSISETMGNLTISDTSRVYDLDANNSTISLDTSVAGGTVTLAPNAKIQGNAGITISSDIVSISAGSIVKGDDSILIKADALALLGDLMAQNTGSTGTVTLRNKTPGGVILAIVLDSSGVYSTPIIGASIAHGTGTGFTLGIGVSPFGSFFLVSSISIGSGGEGYTSPPIVTFSDPGVGGSRATAHVNPFDISTGRPLLIGADDTVAAMGVTQAEMDHVFADRLILGYNGNGATSFDSTVTPANFNALEVISGDTITDADGAVLTVSSLLLTAFKGVTMDNLHDVDTIAGSSLNSGVPFTFSDADGFSVGTVGSVSGITTSNGDINLTTAAGSILINSALNVGSASISLTGPDLVLNQPLTANGNIILQPYAPTSTIGINDTSSIFNVTSDELTSFVSSTGTVIIGRADGTGSIFVGSADLSAESYNLTLRGLSSPVEMRGALTLSNDRTFTFANGGAITSPGGATDITIGGTLGTVRLTSATSVGTTTDPLTLSVARLGTSTTTGQINLQDSRSLAVVGAVSSGNNNINISAQGNDFSNTVAGTVNAGTAQVKVTSDTIALGGVITGNGGITLQPFTTTTTLALNDATGTFSLTAAELQILASTGTVTIGRTDGSGTMSLGSVGAINLFAENYHLTLEGGTSALTFNFAAGTSLTLNDNKTLSVSTGGAITSPGASSLDMQVGGALGTISFGSATTVGTLANNVNILVNNIGASAISGDAFINNNGPTAFTGASSFGSLALVDNGAVTQTAALTVTGATSITAGVGNNITLSNAGNNFGGAVSIVTGNNVILVDSNALDLGGSTVSGNLTITAGGAITDSGNLLVAGNTSITGFAGSSVSLNSAGNTFTGTVTVSPVGLSDVTLVDTTAIDLTGMTITGNLAVTAAGVTDSAMLTVGGTATFTAGVNDVILDFGNNIAGLGIVSANNVTINNVANNINLAASTIAGNLNITAGSMTDSGIQIVTGTTTLTGTAGGSIVLDTVGNTFTGVLNIGPAGLANVSITDTTAVDLTGLTVTGNLTILSGGAITDSGTLNVAGTTTLNAGANNITVDDAANDFGTLALTGNAVTVVDADDVVLGTSAIAGAFDLTANGAVTQTGVAAVTGTSTFNAGAANSIVLNNAGNNFSTVIVTSADSASFTDSNAIDLGASTVAQNLTINTTGSITQSGVLTVPNIITVNAPGYNVTLANPANDFGTLAVTAAYDVSVQDVDDLDFGASTIAGALSATSSALAGDFTQTGAMTVFGATSLTSGAGNFFILNNAGNQFSAVSVNGVAQTLPAPQSATVDITGLAAVVPGGGGGPAIVSGGGSGGNTSTTTSSSVFTVSIDPIIQALRIGDSVNTTFSYLQPKDESQLEMTPGLAIGSGLSYYGISGSSSGLIGQGKQQMVLASYSSFDISADEDFANSLVFQTQDEDAKLKKKLKKTVR